MGSVANVHHSARLLEANEVTLKWWQSACNKDWKVAMAGMNMLTAPCHQILRQEDGPKIPWVAHECSITGIFGCTWFGSNTQMLCRVIWSYGLITRDCLNICPKLSCVSTNVVGNIPFVLPWHPQLIIAYHSQVFRRLHLNAYPLAINHGWLRNPLYMGKIHHTCWIIQQEYVWIPKGVSHIPWNLHLFNGQFRNLNWSYPPVIRPM